MFGILTREKSKRVYPRAFWLLFWGVFLNRVSFSVLWPFLTVFLTQQLGMPLTTATLLISLRSFSSLLTTSIIAALMDRFGRKRAMLAGLVASAGLFVCMAGAQDVTTWAILMLAHGVVMPVFNIGVYAMIADLIPAEHRTDAYALTRVVANAGIAIGPILGGLVIMVSFSAIFLITAAGFVGLALLFLLYVPETAPSIAMNADGKRKEGSYRELVRDRLFISFILAYFFTEMASTHMFGLLNVYVSTQFGLLPAEYSLLVTINAVMVVLFQVPMTRFTAQYRSLWVLMIGSFIYLVGTVSVIFGSTLLHFAISMVLVTIAELVFSPTAITLTAKLAPDHMRARYLGLFELMYPIANGVGPVIGGILSDNIAPVAMWYSASLMVLIGTLGFWWLAHHYERPRQDVTAAAVS